MEAPPNAEYLKKIDYYLLEPEQLSLLRISMAKGLPSLVRATEEQDRMLKAINYRGRHLAHLRYKRFTLVKTQGHNSEKSIATLKYKIAH